MISEQKVIELKSKHGDELIEVEAADGTSLVFRKPRRQEYDRWFDTREDKGSAAARELATACLVEPGYEAFIAVLDRQPAFLMCKGGVLDAITDLAGFAGGSKPKKL